MVFFRDRTVAKIEWSEILAVQIEKKGPFDQGNGNFGSKKGKSLRVLLPKKQVNSRGTDIFSMFLTRDDPTTRSRIVPRNHGNRGCPSIWSWWSILLVPNWTLRIVPNWAFWSVLFLCLDIQQFQYLKLWIPQFPRVPLKIAGAKPLQFSHNKQLVDVPNFQEFHWKLQGRSPCNFPILWSLWMPLMDAPWVPQGYGG